jgi:uncharacterized membrane protein
MKQQDMSVTVQPPGLLMPYGAGLLLLLLIMGIDLVAISRFFGGNSPAVLVGMFMMLEGFFVGWRHHYCNRTGNCLPAMKFWIKLFYLIFTLLGICSVAAFAVRELAEGDVYMEGLRVVFWVLAITLLLIGAGMSLCIVGGDDDGEEQDKPAGKSPWGKAGYP